MHAHGTDTDLSNDPGVELLAGLAAIGTAVAGVAYAVAFVGLKSNLWSAIFLLVGSALSLFVLVAVYERFASIEPRIARWALIVAVIGAAGAAIHGGYDLSIQLHPEAATTGLPNPVDPRGLLTFGASGIALLTGAWLVTLSRELPTWAAWLAGATGLALLATYLGRLVVLDANSPYVIGPALVAGALSPIVYVALGIWLLQEWGGRRP